jgi:signal transduction histidine kinase
MGMDFAMIDSVLDRERTLSAARSLEQFAELLPQAVLIRSGDAPAWLNAPARDLEAWLQAAGSGPSLPAALNDAVRTSACAPGGSALRSETVLTLRGSSGEERAYRMSTLDLPVHPDSLVVSVLSSVAAEAAGSEWLDARAQSEIALARIEEVQRQLLQADRLSTIGQLAAGVAHEINNPIGYVQSNLETLRDYVASLFRLITAQDTALRHLRVTHSDDAMQVEQVRQQIDYEFLTRDLPTLLSESQEGIARVRKIIQDLREFSRAGHAEDWAFADIHAGIDSTINIVWNELKYKVELVKNYGNVPPVECLPSQLNQVFMNILVNAGHAIEKRGTITISTRTDGDFVQIEISDSGKGIEPEHLQRVFEPFFTTKPVGKGTGLGLSISYGIVRKHNGEIDVRSEVGVGTTFLIRLPLRQSARDGDAAT